MPRHLIFQYAACLLVGFALSRSAPARWEWGWMQGPMLGSALYFGALHRYARRRSPAGDESRGTGADAGGLLPGLMIRALVFLAVVGVQAYLCYEAVPHADVRAGFIVSSTWLVALAVIDPPRAPD